MAYIVISRRSPSARFLDVELEELPETSSTVRIAVHDELPENHPPVLDKEDDLIAYVNSQETSERFVEVNLARKVLGWSIP